jgi:hypothetical protein
VVVALGGWPGHPSWRSAMNRTSMHAFRIGLGVVLACGATARPAWAIKQFQDEFKHLYAKEGSPLAAEVERVKCNVCHVGKDKKERNAYGKALDERLDKKADKDDKDKIRKMLEEVAALPSDPAKADSPTFGALIKEGKLPVAVP